MAGMGHPKYVIKNAIATDKMHNSTPVREKGEIVGEIEKQIRDMERIGATA